MTIELKERTLQSKLRYWADYGKHINPPPEVLLEAAAQLDALTAERDEARIELENRHEEWRSQFEQRVAAQAKLATALQQCANGAAKLEAVDAVVRLREEAARTHDDAREKDRWKIGWAQAVRGFSDELRAALATPSAQESKGAGTGEPACCPTCNASGSWLQAVAGRLGCVRCGRLWEASPERGTGDGIPLSDDFLGKALDRFADIEAAAKVTGRRSSLELVVAYILDHLKQQRAGGGR
jgi:hypothetical protein